MGSSASAFVFGIAVGSSSRVLSLKHLGHRHSPLHLPLLSLVRSLHLRLYSFRRRLPLHLLVHPVCPSLLAPRRRLRSQERHHLLPLPVLVLRLCPSILATWKLGRAHERDARANVLRPTQWPRR